MSVRYAARSIVEADAGHLRRKPWLLPFLGLVGVVACWIGLGFWHSFNISLHEGRIGGTVTGLGSHGVILYEYTVDQHRHSGKSTGDFTRIYPKGSEVEVRYSRTHPSWSTLVDPLLFPKQVTFAALIVGGILICVYFAQKRKRRTA
jgi:hypothetical protein